MFGGKGKTFPLFSITLAVVMFSGCSATIGSKVFAYKDPVTDPDIHVDIYVPNKAWHGTTLLADNHRLDRPRIIEVDMQGRIIWEYHVPYHLREYNNPGFDVELLPNDNVLFVLPRHGIYEIDRTGKVLWSYLDDKVSHDADRLSNGNTLVVFGNDDGYDDRQVKEISPDGRLVWSWRAKDHFWREPFKDIFRQGWTHTNAAERLPNGNTLISLRNFNFVAEVDEDGRVVRTIGEGVLWHQHDPEMLTNGHLLTANHTRERAVEIDTATNQVVWRFVPHSGKWRVRDANRLPNGNTLITDATKIAEVSPEGEIVWLLKVKGVTYQNIDWPRRGFYKAERITPH